MTIQFHCPKCGSLIAFTDKHAGQTAKCLTCGQKQIIPEKSGQTPQKVEPKVEPEFPLPGFYHAVFVDSWKIFFDKDNLTAIVFVIAVVCFKFFSAGTFCLGYFVYFAAWGYLFGFYLQIINETATSSDKLPEIEMGTSITFLFHIIKPIFIFAFTVFIVQLPFIAALSFFKEKASHGKISGKRERLEPVSAGIVCRRTLPVPDGHTGRGCHRGPSRTVPF